MERDFLGVRNEDFGARGQDGAFTASAVQWPFSNKTSAMQQYMSYKTAQEERQKRFVIEQYSPSGFQSMSTMDAFEASQKAPTMKFDRQAVNQFPMQSFQSQTAETLINSSQKFNENIAFPVVSHHSFPVATSTPFVKVHGAQNGQNITVTSLTQQPYAVGMNTLGAASAFGTLPSRNMPKHAPSSAQLTIFYAGSVNVYDNIPFDKAQAIMLLASNGSNAGSDVKPKSEVPAQPTAPAPTLKATVSVPNLRTTVSAPMFQTTVTVPTSKDAVPAVTMQAATVVLNSNRISNPASIRLASPCSAVSSPLSVTSRLGANSACVSSTTDDTVGPKAAAQITSASQQENSKSTIAAGSGPTTPADVVPRAVPQARKASLARFLEKRKERVSSAMPYPCNEMKITSLTDANLSSKRAETWSLEQPKASVTTEGLPSTKLQM